MNTWILHKVSRQKYRKYAIRISLIAHVVMFLTIPFIFIQQQIQEMEDEIAVELIPPKYRLIDPPHQAPVTPPPPVPKIDVTPPPPVPKIEMPEIEIETPQKRVVEKEINAIAHKQSLEIAKLPASAAAIEIEHPASQNIEVDAPILETQDLATDARLEPTEDSILSPNVSGGAGIDKADITKRRGTGVRSPSKNTGDGITSGVSQTGAAEGTGQIGTVEGISQAGTGKKNGSGTGNSGEGRGTGNGNGSDTFSSIIGELTDDIIASSGGLPVDVVFVVDASGSMQDNINAVAEHLGQMVDAYKASEIDYQLGLTYFNVDQSQNNIQVFPLTRDLKTYKRRLYEIRVTGDEHALDAIHQTSGQMRFRKKTIKHLILVTDEPFTSMQGHSVWTVIELCKSNELLVNVLGNNIPEHKQLAEETGGTWHAVPQDKKRTFTSRIQTNPLTIGNTILADAANMPVDVIMFIDSSKSMENKTTYITQQIDLWIRDWDNGRIDYRLGVVRFRIKQSLNIVNVFDPPRTQKQIHSILRLPCSDDENLLHAVKDGINRLTLRPNAKTHFILITDEPGNPKEHIDGTIGLLNDMSVTVHVLGATDTFQQQVAAQTGGVYVKMPNAYNINSGGE